MSSQDPIGSTVPSERPTEVPLSEHLNETKTKSPEGEQGSESSLWQLAKRTHVPTLLAIGGIVWLLASLVRRSTERW